MKIRTAIMWVSGLAVAAGFAGWFPLRDSCRGHGQLNPRPGSVTRCYSLSYSGQSTFDIGGLLDSVGQQPDGQPAPSPNHFTLEFRGELRRTELEHSAKSRLEYLELRDATVSLNGSVPGTSLPKPDPSPALRAGFFVKYSGGNGPRIAVPVGTSSLDLQVIRGLVAHLQWTQSEQPGDTKWRAAEQHPYGRLTCEYRREPHKPDVRSSMQNIHRRWVALQSSAPAIVGGMELTCTVQPEGEIVAEFDSSEPVWRSLRGQEILRTFVRNRLVAEATEQIDVRNMTLQVSSVSDVEEIRRHLAMLTSETNWLALSPDSTPAEAEAAANRVTLGEDTAESLLASVTAADGLTNGVVVGRLARKLAALFALQPDASTNFASILQNAPGDSCRSTVILGAWAASGAPSAQDIIADALRESRDDDRLVRILIGVSDCRNPGGKLIREVMGLTTHPDPEVQSTALLVLGALAQQSDPRAAANIVGDLRTRLARSAPDEQAPIILAIGNASPTNLFEMLEPFAFAREPGVREAVARALASSASPASETGLLTLLVRDADADVRYAATTSLAAKPRSLATWTKALDHLRDETDPETRCALLEALWRHSQNLAGLKDVTSRLASDDGSSIVRRTAERLVRENRM